MTGSAESTWTGTLRNGVALTIRPLRADDREKIARAVRELDRESVYLRLFSYRTEFTEAALDRIMKVDPEREVALIATVGAAADEIIVGSGRCYIAAHSDGSRTGEVAFIVEEDYQGLGIAGRLLARLIEFARMRRFAALEADVLAENKAMLAVFARSGLPMRKRRDGGTVHVTLSLQGEEI